MTNEKTPCDCGHEQQCPLENYWRLRLLRGCADARYGVRYQLCELLRQEADRQRRLSEQDRDDMHALYQPPKKLVRQATRICAHFLALNTTGPQFQDLRTQGRLNVEDAVRHGVHDVYGAIIRKELNLKEDKPDQAVEEPEALPEKLRTKGYHKDQPDGGFEAVEPITVLRLPYCGVLAEIVQVSYWIADKGDGCVFYQVNLIDPHAGVAFTKKQQNTVTLDYIPGNREAGEFAKVERLLKEAEAYIQRRMTAENAEPTDHEADAETSN